MSAYTNFGVSYTDISARLHNTDIFEGSSPSSTTVQSIIDENASLVCGEARASGIEPIELGSGTSEYINLKAAVLYKSIADYLVLEQRGKAEAGSYWLEQYRVMIKSIRERPQVIEQTGTGPNLAAVVTSLPNKTNTFDFSISGKIVNGGI